MTTLVAAVMVFMLIAVAPGRAMAVFLGHTQEDQPPQPPELPVPTPKPGTMSEFVCSPAVPARPRDPEMSKATVRTTSGRCSTWASYRSGCHAG